MSHFPGVQCPQCGSGNLKVVSTRRGPNVTYRRRACSQNHRFWTLEAVVEGPPPREISQMWDNPKFRSE